MPGKEEKRQEINCSPCFGCDKDEEDLCIMVFSFFSFSVLIFSFPKKVFKSVQFVKDIFIYLSLMEFAWTKQEQCLYPLNVVFYVCIAA